MKKLNKQYLLYDEEYAIELYNIITASKIVDDYFYYYFENFIMKNNFRSILHLRENGEELFYKYKDYILQDKENRYMCLQNIPYSIQKKYGATQQGNCVNEFIADGYYIEEIFSDFDTSYSLEFLSLENCLRIINNKHQNIHDANMVKIIISNMFINEIIDNYPNMKFSERIFFNKYLNAVNVKKIFKFRFNKFSIQK